MLFSRPKYIFYHIPKTGGTTLKSFIDQRFNLSDICPRSLFHPSVVRISSLDSDRKSALKKYRLIQDHFFFDIKSSVGGKAKSFTWLRDPRRRVVSQFYYFQSYTDIAIDSDVAQGRMLRARADAIRALRHMTLRDFLLNPIDELAPEFMNTQTSIVRNAFSYRSVPITPEACFDLAVKNLMRFDFFGLLELFEPSLQMMCHQFDWRYPQIVQTLNELAYKQKPERIVEEHADLLHRFVDWDLKLYTLAQREFLARYRKFIQKLWRRHPDMELDSEMLVSNPFMPTSQAWIQKSLRWTDGMISNDISRHFPGLRQSHQLATVRLRMNQALLGEGWLEREGGETPGSAVCRWTGPGCLSEVYFLLRKGMFFLISVVVQEVLFADILTGVKLMANGHELQMVSEPMFERGAKLIAVLPSDVIKNGLVKLEILVPRTASHFEFNGASDKRRKGLRISEISLIPTTKLQVEKLSVSRKPA